MKKSYRVFYIAATAIATLLPSTSYGQRPSGTATTPNAPMMKDDKMMHPMAVGAMDMKKAQEMATPAMLKKAGESLMASPDMPKMMAHEMSMAATMQKPSLMSMVTKQSNMMTSSGPPMVSDEEVKIAIRKIIGDQAQFQALLQMMVARETASAMVASAPEMATPMMEAEPAIMAQAKDAMMSEKSMIAVNLAKEMIIQAMSNDERFMAMVKTQAMSTTMPMVKGMMKEEKMMMAGKEMKTPAMQKGMMKDAMMRTMAQPSMAAPDMKKK